jgi:hypothetical protein
MDDSIMEDSVFDDYGDSDDFAPIAVPVSSQGYIMAGQLDSC